MNAASGDALVELSQRTLERLQLLSRIAEQVGEGVAVFDNDDRIVYANPALAAVHGCEPQDLLGRHVSEFLGPDTSYDEFQAERAEHDVDEELVVEAEVEAFMLDGRQRDLRLTVSALLDGSGERMGRILCIQDITERKALEKQLERAAYYDPLTDLANRRLLLERLELALSAAESDRTTIALLYVDLDKFKVVNDTYGHEIGDKVLIEVAERLRSIARDTDMICRLGGDEFVLLLDPLAQSSQAKSIADRVVVELGVPYVVDGEISVSASVGVVIGATGSYRSLLHAADGAMYHAKSKGGGQVHAES